MCAHCNFKTVVSYIKCDWDHEKEWSRSSVIVYGTLNSMPYLKLCVGEGHAVTICRLSKVHAMYNVGHTVSIVKFTFSLRNTVPTQRIEAFSWEVENRQSNNDNQQHMLLRVNPVHIASQEGLLFDFWRLTTVSYKPCTQRLLRWKSSAYWATNSTAEWCYKAGCLYVDTWIHWATFCNITIATKMNTTIKCTLWATASNTLTKDESKNVKHWRGRFLREVNNTLEGKEIVFRENHRKVIW